MNPASCGCVGLHSPPGEMPLGCVLGRNKTLQPRLCASCPVCSCSSGWQLWNTSAYGFNCSSKRSAVFCNARHLHCSPSANRAEQLWNKQDLSFLKAIKDGRYFSQHCAWCLLAFGFRYDLIRELWWMITFMAHVAADLFSGCLSIHWFIYIFKD